MGVGMTSREVVSLLSWTDGVSELRNPLGQIKFVARTVIRNKKVLGKKNEICVNGGSCRERQGC